MASPWQITASSYHLNHAEFSGRVAIRGPAPGLRRLSLTWDRHTVHWPGPLLAVQAIEVAGKPPFPVGFAATRIDHRLRGGLLDVELRETTRCPVRLHLYWNAARARQFDLEVLATTAHKFDTLEIITRSIAPATESPARSQCLVRMSTDSGRWVDVGATLRVGTECIVIPRDRDAATLATSSRSPSLKQTILAPPLHCPIVCYRPADQSWSYVEMTHPDCCVRIIARRERARVSWGFGLFGLDIEKGVILRARVRAAFVPRRRDTYEATRLLQQFLAEPPHLSV